MTLPIARSLARLCPGVATGMKTVGMDGTHALAQFAKVINNNLVGSFNMIRLDGAIRLAPK